MDSFERQVILSRHAMKKLAGLRRELRFVCFRQNLFPMFIESRRESPDVARGARESHGDSDGSHYAFRRVFFALKKSERLQVFVIEEVFGR
jgi:hypothetical protein